MAESRSIARGGLSRMQVESWAHVRKVQISWHLKVMNCEFIYIRPKRVYKTCNVWWVSNTLSANTPQFQSTYAEQHRPVSHDTQSKMKVQTNFVCKTCNVRWVTLSGNTPRFQSTYSQQLVQPPVFESTDTVTQPNQGRQFLGVKRYEAYERVALDQLWWICSALHSSPAAPSATWSG
jgi:hypothetical protein